MTSKLLLLFSLLLIAFSQVNAKEGYPDFSWDRVPLYSQGSY